MSLKKICGLLPLLVVASFLSGCGSVPKTLSGYDAGQFKSKALIRDLTNNKSNVVNLDLKAYDLQNFRLDVTTSLGMHIFSLVHKPEGLEYIVVPNKQHFKGKSSSKALAPIFSAPLDPKYLPYVFLEKAIPDKNWSCDKDSAGVLVSCRELKTKMVISWDRNKDGAHLVKISYPGVSTIQINVNDFSKDLKDREKTLQLKVPESFKTIKI